MRSGTILLIAACTIALISCGGPATANLVDQDQVRFTEKDRTEFARADFDDSGWSEASLGWLPHPDGVLWLRATIRMPSGVAPTTEPVGLFFAALASHEIYWDGELIGLGGVPALDATEETPGPLEALYYVPERLATPGEHIIAIRTSAHHRHFVPRNGYWTLLVGDYGTITSLRVGRNFLSLVSLSGIVIVGLFALVMFLIVDREDRSWLLLSAVCFVAAALLVAESWRGLGGYTYNWHLLRLVVITILTAALNIVLLLFLVVRFRGRGGRVFLAIAVTGILMSLLKSGFDDKAILMFGTGLTLSLVWSARAIAAYGTAAILATTGVGVTIVILILAPMVFADFALFYSLDLLLVCLLVSHALEVKRSMKEREDALVKSARLETELLKKHVQPHFMMNTLTALSEWIEQEPEVASSMIVSLSEEFRLLSEISHRSLIRIEDELRLCRSHLEIMSRRKGRIYILETEGIDPEASIPPAVIHTLVENAITHSRYDDDRVVMCLNAENHDSNVRYVFDAPLGSELPTSEAHEGTGLRYIRARLTESFGSDWTLESAPRQNVWRTTMTFPRRESES